jgi:catechol 2,3-dioxygenase-like lactoylglutathione lyase family enzyme
MIDHVILNVTNYEDSKRFYDAALGVLGIAGVEAEGFCGYGAFFITQREPVGGSLHIAFQAKDSATIEAFHEAATGAGGTDHGQPGPRPAYGDGYYAAFVLDPDGNNIEATLAT